MNYITIEQAATTAAKFWSDFLYHRSPPFDVGDPNPQREGLYGLGVSLRKSLSRKEKEEFNVVLRDIIIQKLNTLPWDKNDPDLAGALRVISSEYGPGHEHRKAAELVGINIDFYIPHKTITWLSPTGVTAKIGYGGKIKRLVSKPVLIVWDYDLDGEPTLAQLAELLEGFVVLTPIKNGRYLAHDEDASIGGKEINDEVLDQFRMVLSGNVVLLEKYLEEEVLL